MNFAKLTSQVINPYLTYYLDYVKEKNKKIEIFKIQRPTDGHYIILEVLGMPTGKTFQLIKLSERHSLKIVLNMNALTLISGKRP